MRRKKGSLASYLEDSLYYPGAWKTLEKIKKEIQNINWKNVFIIVLAGVIGYIIGISTLILR